MSGIARTELGAVEIMRTFDGGRWMWNEKMSWLEYIQPGHVVPWTTCTLAPRQNNLYEAVMVACRCEEQRVYQIRALELAG